MMQHNTSKLATGGLLSALTCVLTMVIQIPSPMSGYVNLGDCTVLLSGWILGPWYGFAAAGIGSMLADLFAGYGAYAPATFLIKGTMALIAGLLCRHVSHNNYGRMMRVLSATVAESVMVLGYFAHAALMLGNGWGASASIPGNVVQGVVGLVSAVCVMELISRSAPMRDALHLNQT